MESDKTEYPHETQRSTVCVCAQRAPIKQTKRFPASCHEYAFHVVRKVCLGIKTNMHNRADTRVAYVRNIGYRRKRQRGERRCGERRTEVLKSENDSIWLL